MLGALCAAVVRGRETNLPERKRNTILRKKPCQRAPNESRILSRYALHQSMWKAYFGAVNCAISRRFDNCEERSKVWIEDDPVDRFLGIEQRQFVPAEQWPKKPTFTGSMLTSCGMIGGSVENRMPKRMQAQSCVCNLV